MITFSFSVSRPTLTVKAIGTLLSGITVLTGPSGSGKSTFIKSIAGLVKPDEGCIHYNDTIWFDGNRHIWRPAQERQVGYMPQGHIVFPHMTVERNITYSNRGTEEVCNVLLERLGLETYRHTKAGRLSGGEQQRVALGRALYSKPTVLLLDEPLAALDWSLYKQVRNDLVDIIREWTIPCLWVTHNVEDVAAVADRHWVCNNGLITTELV